MSSKDKKKSKKPENDTNIVTEVDGDTLTITVDLSQELRESSTGRSTIIAATKNFDNIEDAEGFGLKLIVTKRKTKEKE
jgi:hypothetical protein